MNKNILINEKNIEYNLSQSNQNDLEIVLEGNKFSFEIIEKTKEFVLLKSIQTKKQFKIYNTNTSEGGHFVLDGKDYFISKPVSSRKNKSIASGDDVLSPMPGKVFKILKNIGDEVKVGDAVMIIEAMKMEHTIKATKDGKITKLFFKIGDQVKAKEKLLDLAEI